MDKIFYNSNGNSYYILFGGKGKRTFLCNLNNNSSANFVICAILEENSWWQGNYYESFEEAYEDWRKN